MKKQTFLLRLALLAITLIIVLAATLVVPTILRSTRWDLGLWVGPFGAGLYGILALVLTAVWQSWQLLKLIAHRIVFTVAATTALAKIKWCAYAVFAIFVLLLPLFYNWAQAEDAPGLLLLALILTGIALVIGVFASILVQLLTTAIKIKNENELTI